MCLCVLWFCFYIAIGVSVQCTGGDVNMFNQTRADSVCLCVLWFCFYIAIGVSVQCIGGDVNKLN